MHHVHNAHLLDNDKRLIRVGSSFSESVKDNGDERKIEKGGSAPALDLRKKDDPSLLRSGKINTFIPTVVPVDAPYPPDLVHKLRVQNRDAGAIEEKVIALATSTRNNEAMIVQKRAEIEAMRLAAEQRAVLLAKQEEIRQAQHLAEEAAQLAAEQARTAKLIEEQRAAQVAADEQAARVEAENKALAAQRAERIESDRAAAQLEADALLARRADEQRQAAIRAQEEETLRAAEAAAAANHAAQQEHSEPVRKSQPPPDPVVPEDAPIGVLAPPAEPVADIPAPADPARDVVPVGNLDPEPEHTVEEAAAQVAAAVAAEMNLGHPNVPPEEDHHEVILPVVPDVPNVPIVPSVPEAATAQVPDLAVPDVQHPVVVLSPPQQAVLPAEPVIPTERAQPIPLAPPQGINPNPGAVEPLDPARSEPERPMSFDLPPDKILKMAAASVPAEVPPGEKIDYCAGSVDPFAAQPVELFQPPAGADFELAMKWRSEVSAMVKKVSKVTVGGEELREMIRNEVDALKVMRFKMFCKYA